MKRCLYFVLVLFFGNQSVAQSVDTLLIEKDTINHKEILDFFIQEFEPTDMADSGFVEAYIYLDTFFSSDMINNAFKIVQEATLNNIVDSLLIPLETFKVKADSLNQERIRLLSDYWQKQRLQNMLDTGGFSTEDTLFVEALDAVMYQDSINIDSALNELVAYNDTLILAINSLMYEYNRHFYSKWIRNVRNDTVDMYLVNIDGDSLPIRLYDNNPSLIRFGLTDYWGSAIPAVIRNIERRSFKIYVDDGPETNYTSDNKAKEALKGFVKDQKFKKLTITPIKIEIAKPVWSIKGRTNLNISQVGMYQWAQGGDPSISLEAGIDLAANYKKGKQNWDNTGKFEYGVIRQGRYKDTAIHFNSNKDRLEIASKYGYKVFGKNYLTFEGDFKSRFTPQYNWVGNEKTDEIISEFMSPGYLTFSLGLDYKPNDNTTIFAAPVTNKSTYVLLNDAKIKSNYGVDTTKNARHEIGARIKVNHKAKVWDDIEVKNSLELFSSYLNNPENVDLNWELAIILPVNDFIRASITTNIIYDDDTKVPKYEIVDGAEAKVESSGMQFREMIAIGFTARF